MANGHVPPAGGEHGGGQPPADPPPAPPAGGGGGEGGGEGGGQQPPAQPPGQQGAGEGGVERPPVEPPPRRERPVQQPPVQPVQAGGDGGGDQPPAEPPQPAEPEQARGGERRAPGGAVNVPGDAERFRLIPSTPREWTFAGLLALALAALVGFAVYTATRPDTTTAKAPAPSGATEPADPSAAATPPAPAPSTPPSVPSVASLTQPLKDCVERVGSWGFDLNDSTVRADAIAGCKLPR